MSEYKTYFGDINSPRSEWVESDHKRFDPDTEVLRCEVKDEDKDEQTILVEDVTFTYKGDPISFSSSSKEITCVDEYDLEDMTFEFTVEIRPGVLDTLKK